MGHASIRPLAQPVEDPRFQVPHSLVAAPFRIEQAVHVREPTMSKEKCGTEVSAWTYLAIQMPLLRFVSAYVRVTRV